MFKKALFPMIIVSCYTELNLAMNDAYDDSDMNISEIEEENSCIDNKFRTKCSRNQTYSYEKMMIYVFERQTPAFRISSEMI